MRTKAQISEWREALVAEVCRCEFCGLRNRVLQPHEVARGIHRQKALCARFAILVLCLDCHAAVHRMAGEDQRGLGLALLRRSRPHDYNLEAFYDLTDRRFPSPESVRLWGLRLAFVTNQ